MCCQTHTVGEASEGDDLAPFQALLAALQRPFEDQPPYMQPAPNEVTACYRTFCGT